MADVLFKKGLLANLPAAKAAGTFYVTTDERALYLDVDDSTRIRIGDFQEFANLEALQDNTNPSTSALYYITDLNVLAKYDGSEYVQINLDTGATSIEVTGEGNVISGASYDPVTRKITLTKSNLDLEGVTARIFQTTYSEDVFDPASYQENAPYHAGDVLIATHQTSQVKTAFGYDANTAAWVAFNGNVYADNVIIKDNIKLAGNYTQVGNITKASNTTTGTFTTTGKSVIAALTEIFSKKLQPEVTAHPAVSITFAQAKEYEVGTNVTPSYSASLSAGSYTYGPATGITATSWSVTDTNSNNAETNTGSFPQFTVGDNTNYTITATAQHNEGAVAYDNLGGVSEPQVKIAAGSKSKTSNAVTGYRNMFFGSSTTVLTADSDTIRGLAKKQKAAATTVAVTIVEGSKHVILAVPKGRTVTKVEDTGAFGTDIFASSFVLTEDVMVEGANGYTAKEYNVYEYKPAAPLGANTYNVTVK